MSLGSPSLYMQGIDLSYGRCKQVALCNWPCLKILNLSKIFYYWDNCKINSEGCLYLVEGKWPNLIGLSLSNYDCIQVITILPTKDVNISVKDPGKNFRILNYRTVVSMNKELYGSLRVFGQIIRWYALVFQYLI